METGYVDVRGRHRRASAEALLGVLRALGAPLRRASEAKNALEKRRRELARRFLEPVVLCRPGERNSVRLGAALWSAGSPAGRAAGSVRVEVFLREEGGRVRRWILPSARLEESRSGRGGAGEIALPADLPSGYHRLTVSAGRRSSEALVICAPRTCWSPPGESKDWGLFLPLYALRWGGNRGAGDLSGLGKLAQWAGKQGAGIVGTLPLFPVFLDRPFNPSPYAPVSRLLWGELWVDVSASPELSRCARARDLLGSYRFTRELAELERMEWVDYRRLMARKREALEILAEEVFERLPSAQEQLRRFLRKHPHVEPYARFRAGRDRKARRYYLYAQWLAHRQMRSAGEKARRAGVRLYLDLPLGVHPAGYDVRSQGDLFARGASCGAPPDSFFSHGQDWGFPPQDPGKMRGQGYRYLRDVLGHSMRAAGILRIDHVLGLHRKFWVPKGFSAKEGVYVRYPAKELYAVLALESRRNRCVVAGEDLGTVPPEVRPAMARHGVRRTFVLQYELRPDPRRPVPPIPAPSVASLNTHDMPPFAAFLSGEDIRRQQRMGLLNRGAAAREKQHRLRIQAALLEFLSGRERFVMGLPPAALVLQTLLKTLAKSAARTVLLNLEDLWGERRPHNMPGTVREYPNWRRRAIHALESFGRVPHLLAALEEIRRLRTKRNESDFS